MLDTFKEVISIVGVICVFGPFVLFLIGTLLGDGWEQFETTIQIMGMGFVLVFLLLIGVEIYESNFVCAWEDVPRLQHLCDN